MNRTKDEGVRGGRGGMLTLHMRHSRPRTDKTNEVIRVKDLLIYLLTYLST